MRYVGGKTRAAKHIVAEIAARVDSGPWWDPFCGGLSMSVSLTKQFGPGRVSDANQALVSLYQAVATGWAPPDSVSEDEYKAAKSLPASDPLKAFIGIGCSFGAKWFGGYARGDGRNFAAESSQALVRDVPQVCEVKHIDFLKEKPNESFRFLYLDPPYRGTLGYAGSPPFNYERFVVLAHEWSRCAHVFVSEYDFPGECIWEREQKTTVTRGAGKSATERLFYLPKLGKTPKAQPKQAVLSFCEHDDGTPGTDTL